MATSRRTVHVFSRIPRLAKLIQEKLSDDNVIDVKRKDIVQESLCEKVYDEEISLLQDAEILVVDNPLLAQISDKLPKIKWVQGTWAGVEGLLKTTKKPPPFPISRFVNTTFSQLMAEYTLGWILIYERGFLECRYNQLENKWESGGKMLEYRSLKELTVGVLGMGNIGKEVARSLKAFHCKIYGFTRTVPSPECKSMDVDRYWYSGELHEFLEECDYIVNVMPSTPKTRGMLGNDVFKSSKKAPVFINIGRGDVISETDLIKALDAGWLSAAVLDVFEEEPLPKESKLWKHQKVMLTPHIAGASRAEDVAEAFLMNYQLFVSGQQVTNLIDWNSGY